MFQAGTLTLTREQSGTLESGYQNPGSVQQSSELGLSVHPDGRTKNLIYEIYRIQR